MADPSPPKRAEVLDRLNRRRRARSVLEPRLSQPSFGQERLWFLDCLKPGTHTFNEGSVLHLSPALDLVRLGQAIEAVCAAHESLRTGFVSHTRGLQRFVKEPAGGQLRVLEAADVQAGLGLARALISEPYSLEHPPLVRFAAIRLRVDGMLLVLANHHIVGDAWSRGILAQRVAQAYGAVSTGQAVELPEEYPYGAFVERQRAFVQSETGQKQLAWWVRTLADVEPLRLPDFAGTKRLAATTEGRRIERICAGDLVRAVPAYCKDKGVTGAALWLSAFGNALARMAHQTDFAIGVAANSRDDREAALVGFAVNTLPIRYGAEGSFHAQLEATQTRLFEALENADVPLEQVIAAVNPPRDFERPPIFQVGFNFQPSVQMPVFGDSALHSAQSLDIGVSRLEISLEVAVGHTETWIGMEYRAAVLPDAAAQSLLKEIIAKVEREVGVEQAAPAPFAHVAGGATAGACLRLANCAAATPDAVACTTGQETLSAAALQARAEQIAGRLRNSVSGAGGRIALCAHTSAEAVAAVFAILGSGNVYVPLDPAWPDARKRDILADAKVAVLLVVDPADVPVDIPDNIAVLCLGDLPDETEARTPLVAAPAQDEAYLIYTSGSTGKPKGVRVSHGNLAIFLAGMDQLLGTRVGRWFAHTSLAFDISLLEVLWAVTSGATLQFAEPVRPRRGTKLERVQFSLFFFGSEVEPSPAERLELVIQGARHADEIGLCAVWTPERHFNQFGGLFPNPSVLAAALARETRRIGIRAGSVVAPLHHPVRIAEEWALVDNLSGGRTGIALASGWHADDFVLNPGAYEDRHARVSRAIEVVRALWAGERCEFENGAGLGTTVDLHPRPVQEQLPLWLTASRNTDAFEAAGKLGAGVLTHLVETSFDEMAERMKRYHASRRADAPSAVLMMHTHLEPDAALAVQSARPAMRNYLMRSGQLVKALAASAGVQSTVDGLTPEDEAALIEHSVNRYMQGSSLIGSPRSTGETVERAIEAGVEEIACLVDFGMDDASVAATLTNLAKLSEDVSAAPLHRGPNASDHPAIAAMQSGCRHIQLTPSQLRAVLADPAGRAALDQLETLLVGGEPFGADLVQALAGLEAEVINLYGPTEATIWSLAARVSTGGHGSRSHAEAPPVGRPLAGYGVSVRDAEGATLAPYFLGEICIFGPAVSLGYENRAVETARAFAEHSGTRHYRTGDKGYCDADGQVYCLGRLDSQLKIRGVRFEPEEVEAAAKRQPGVVDAACCVVARDEEADLVLFVVAGAGAVLDGAALRRAMAHQLPRYLLPNTVHMVAELPCTTAGKLDRLSLPKIQAQVPKQLPIAIAADTTGNLDVAPPELLARILSLWSDLLEVRDIKPTDDFFALGGHSLLAGRMLVRCRTELGLDVGLADLLQDPTPEHMASLAAANERAIANDSV